MSIDIILGDSVASIDIIQLSGPEGPQGPAGADGVDGVGAIDYSTAEQDTGTEWIDGKTIFQTTLTIPGAVPDFPSQGSLVLNITGQVERLIDFRGSVSDSSGSGSGKQGWRPIPTAAEDDAHEIRVVYDPDPNFHRIRIEAGPGFVGRLSDMAITIRYTKV